MKLLGTFAVLMFCFVLFTGCASTELKQKLEQKDAEIQKLQNTVMEQEQLVSSYKGQVNTLTNETIRLRRDLEGARKTEKPGIGITRDSESVTLPPELEKEGFTIAKRDGKNVITLPSAVLFSPGKADLTKKGRETLKKLAGVLEQNFPGKKIRVEGHTDNTPLKKTKTTYIDNWGLSCARALSVLRFLVEECKMKADKLCAVGYGDTVPIADNKTEEGKKKNRRVEIVIETY